MLVISKGTKDTDQYLKLKSLRFSKGDRLINFRFSEKTTKMQSYIFHLDLTFLRNQICAAFSKNLTPIFKNSKKMITRKIFLCDLTSKLIKKLSYFAFRSLGTLVSFHSYLHRGLDQIFCRAQRAYLQWDQKLCKFAFNVLNILVYTIFSPKQSLGLLHIFYLNYQLRKQSNATSSEGRLNA